MTEPRISIDQLKTTFTDKQLTFVDVRRHPSGEQVRGAVRYDPEALLAAGKLALPLPHNRPIIVYCTSPNEATSARVALKLRESGYRDAVALVGGFDAYVDAGLPTEGQTLEQPITEHEESELKP